MPDRVETTIGGKLLAIETGKLAEQANAAVTVSYGDTMVLVTICTRPPNQKFDFFPLTVEYEERLYAAGKIPGGFLRREGRPTQEATLAARLADRSIRPLFPKGFRNEVQIIATVLSADQENTPELLALIGASMAVTLSDIPFDGPVGGVRIGYLDGEFVVNPTFTQLQDSPMDLVVVGTEASVVMVEAGAKEVAEELVMEAIKYGQNINRDIIRIQQELQALSGKPKMELLEDNAESEREAAVSEVIGDKIAAAFVKTKSEREEILTIVREEMLAQLGETYPSQDLISSFESRMKKQFRENILQNGIRPDGRALTEIRPITCEVGILPRTHGSGLFSRGQTQVLSIATLGTTGQRQPLDGLGLEEKKHFMHHYNFPPFSTGETKRVGTPGRREIGHGALAERALAAVIPKEDEFPYTVRLVSEVLSSNGSSSMASVCASTLSAMDAGVPIKAPVSGVAMGLITDGDGRHIILTDIAGLEDFGGDMDFKVAGTAEGITAIQMDTKLKGLSYEIIEQTLSEARDARLFILDRMQEAISHSRPTVSKYAPQIVKLKIDPSKIGVVIGPGGRTIRSIVDESKATVDIENDGTVVIGSSNEESIQKAISIIESLTKEVEVGSIYTGKVTRVLDFGAFVEILPGKEGLVHISELADYRVPSVGDIVKVGDEIMVKVIEIDQQGRTNLSRRAVFHESEHGDGEATMQDTASGGSPSHTPPQRHSNSFPSGDRRRQSPRPPPRRHDRS